MGRIPTRLPRRLPDRWPVSLHPSNAPISVEWWDGSITLEGEAVVGQAVIISARDSNGTVTSLKYGLGANHNGDCDVVVSDGIPPHYWYYLAENLESAINTNQGSVLIATSFSSESVVGIRSKFDCAITGLEDTDSSLTSILYETPTGTPYGKLKLDIIPNYSPQVTTSGDGNGDWIKIHTRKRNENGTVEEIVKVYEFSSDGSTSNADWVPVQAIMMVTYEQYLSGAISNNQHPVGDSSSRHLTSRYDGVDAAYPVYAEVNPGCDIHDEFTEVRPEAASAGRIVLTLME